MSPIDIIIFVCLVVVISYVFQYLSGLLRIPSVVFLMMTGIFFRIGIDYIDYPIFDYASTLQILGTIGLILIVLEGSLDLAIEKHRIRLIRNAFLSALLIFVSSVAAVALFIRYFFDAGVFESILYAIPLATASSAIAIPSASILNRDKKEFIIYETTFSDILGILAFNFCFLESLGSFSFVADVFISIGLTLVLSIVTSIVLIYIIAKSKIRIRFFLIISVLILLYAVGKKFHLPSLLMVLLFGVLLKNNGLFSSHSAFKFLKNPRLHPAINEVEHFTAEVSFVIRTFFFILFGFSIEFTYFQDEKVWLAGSIIIIILLVFRFINLRLINNTNAIFPELFISPRGLISIILFYSIPAELMQDQLNIGTLYFVILASNLIMMIALIFTPAQRKAAVTELAERESQGEIEKYNS